MNLAAVLKPFITPPDPRPEKQIESELDEEFAFHIDQIALELREAARGMSQEEASRRAHARFGDVETLKKRCKRIAMEERIMLQRFNAVLMVIVFIAIGIVSVQVWSSNRATLHTLALINAQIDQMQADAAVEPQHAPPAAAARADGPRVQVVPLRHGNAQDLQHALGVVYDHARGVAIAADSVTNSLIVSAPSALHWDILDTIAELDRPAGEQPTARPALAPGDAVTMEVYELTQPGQWFRTTRTVESGGTLRFPMIGAFEVAGRSPREVEAEAKERLAENMADPIVSVYLTTARSDPDDLDASDRQ